MGAWPPRVPSHKPLLLQRRRSSEALKPKAIAFCIAFWLVALVIAIGSLLAVHWLFDSGHNEAVAKQCKTEIRL